MAERITPRSTDESQWFLDVLREAELADYGPVRGTMVIRPWGFAIWENLQRILDGMFRATGHSNAYFPLLIPMSFLEKEREHVEGFAPELAIVTIGGGKELDEPLVIRPTSETIINHMFAKWIQSYRDLPLLINQWANVVRWELRTKPFLRTSEFLWQEGHTAHATSEEAEEETLRMLGVYDTFAHKHAAVPTVAGEKTDREKFAGAVRSYTIEALLPDGKALQSGTSHFLGQNFARAFEIQYLDTDNELVHVWQTSWGLSTRFVGATIMMHGDDQGLRLPPDLAPIQLVIVPIWRNDDEQSSVREVAHAIASELGDQGVRVHIDERDQRPGWKFNEWEIRGVPLRLEIGPRDVAAGNVVIVRRDNGSKETFPRDGLGTLVPQLLRNVHDGLYADALASVDSMTVEAGDMAALREGIEAGKFVRAWWAGSSDDEARIQEETGATIRCLPMSAADERGRCVLTGADGARLAIFGRAY